MSSTADHGDTPRLIKRYSNRKLYDTAERRFTSLSEISELVGRGVDVVVQDHDTGVDRTEVVLTMGLARALADRVRQAEALTLHLAKQARQTDHRNIGPTVAANSAMFAQMARASIQKNDSPQAAQSAKPDTPGKPAEELKKLRTEVDELARRVDELLLEAER